MKLVLSIALCSLLSFAAAYKPRGVGIIPGESVKEEFVNPKEVLAEDSELSGVSPKFYGSFKKHHKSFVKEEKSVGEFGPKAPLVGEEFAKVGYRAKSGHQKVKGYGASSEIDKVEAGEYGAPKEEIIEEKKFEGGYGGPKEAVEEEKEIIEEKNIGGDGYEEGSKGGFEEKEIIEEKKLGGGYGGGGAKVIIEEKKYGGGGYGGGSKGVLEEKEIIEKKKFGGGYGGPKEGFEEKEIIEEKKLGGGYGGGGAKEIIEERKFSGGGYGRGPKGGFEEKEVIEEKKYGGGYGGGPKGGFEEKEIIEEKKYGGGYGGPKGGFEEKEIIEEKKLGGGYGGGGAKEIIEEKKFGGGYGGGGAKEIIEEKKFGGGYGGGGAKEIIEEGKFSGGGYEGGPKGGFEEKEIIEEKNYGGSYGGGPKGGFEEKEIIEEKKKFGGGGYGGGPKGGYKGGFAGSSGFVEEKKFGGGGYGVVQPGYGAKLPEGPKIGYSSVEACNKLMDTLLGGLQPVFQSHMTAYKVPSMGMLRLGSWAQISLHDGKMAHFGQLCRKDNFRVTPYGEQQYMIEGVIRVPEPKAKFRADAYLYNRFKVRNRDIWLSAKDASFKVAMLVNKRRRKVHVAELEPYTISDFHLEDGHNTKGDLVWPFSRIDQYQLEPYRSRFLGTLQHQLCDKFREMVHKPKVVEQILQQV